MADYNYPFNSLSFDAHAIYWPSILLEKIAVYAIRILLFVGGNNVLCLNDLMAVRRMLQPVNFIVYLVSNLSRYFLLHCRLRFGRLGFLRLLLSKKKRTATIRSVGCSYLGAEEEDDYGRLDAARRKKKEKEKQEEV